MFTNAQFILGGGSEGLLDDGYPANPNSGILANSVPRERTTFLQPADFNVSVGPFPRARDFFGDGSLYIVDSPGHMAGHINALVRTSATGSWLHLAGDSYHDVRIVTGETQVAVQGDDSLGITQCIHADPPALHEHIRRIRALMEVPGVRVLIAHDWGWFEGNRDACFPGKIKPAAVSS